MEIKSYQLIEGNGACLDSSYDIIILDGPRAYIFDDEGDPPYYFEFSSYKFIKIPAGGCEFLIKKNEKDYSEGKKVNYKFLFYITECNEQDGCREFLEREAYVFLDNKKERKLNYLWGKRWFQQNENFKWLITITVSVVFSILTTLVTLYLNN